MNIIRFQLTLTLSIALHYSPCRAANPDDLSVVIVTAEIPILNELQSAFYRILQKNNLSK